MTFTAGLKAYCEGYLAAQAGMPMQANPFLRVSALHHAWGQGHLDAVADAYCSLAPMRQRFEDQMTGGAR